MPDTSKPWLKLWTEIRTDLEIRCVDPAWRWAFVGVLCLAQDLNASGALVLNGKPLSDAAIADAVGIDVAMWREVRAHFSQPGPDGEPGAFCDGPKGALLVTNFARRQAPVDSTAADRQARHRAAKAAQAAQAQADVTDSNALHHASRNADVTPLQTPTEDRGTEDRGQRTEDRSTELNPHMPEAPEATGHLAPASANHGHNGFSSGSVDPSLFLSVIGFRDAEGFLRNNDPLLIAKWAFSYHCLTETQRRAIANWPAAINKAVRANKPPRLTGEQSAAFYRIWTEAQTR
jgi:hypothetical protein